MSTTRSLLVRTIGTRVFVLPVQVAASALIAYITIQALGVGTYATLGLLIGLQALFGFLNLGSSAAVSNAAGESLVLGRARLVGVLVSAVRLTSFAGAITVLGAIAITLAGWWPVILGAGDPSLLTAGALVAIVAVAFVQPLSQGQGVLMATGKTVSATVLNAAATVLTLAFVSVAALLSLPAIVYVAAPFTAQIICAVVACILASRVTSIGLREIQKLCLDRTYKGEPIGHEARPALVMWVLLPMAYQTDRLLINHLSTSSQLASYNLAAQYFATMFSIVSAGSASLWGHFSRARAATETPHRHEFDRLSLAFGVFGAILGIVYFATIPFVAKIISGGQILVSLPLAGGFAMLLAVQSFHQPSAMIQTDTRGLRFNAWAVTAMAIVNVGLGLVLTEPLGAVGPVVASVVALTLFLAAPSYLRARARAMIPSDPLAISGGGLK